MPTSPSSFPMVAQRETFTVNTILFPASSRYLYSEQRNCGHKRILRNTSETVVIRFLILFASVNSFLSIVNNKRNISFCNFIVALYCLVIPPLASNVRRLQISVGVSSFFFYPSEIIAMIFLLWGSLSSNSSNRDRRCVALILWYLILEIFECSIERTR